MNHNFIAERLQNLHDHEVEVRFNNGSFEIRTLIKLCFQPKSSGNKCSGFGNLQDSCFAAFSIDDVACIKTIPEQKEQIIELKNEDY